MLKSLKIFLCNKDVQLIITAVLVGGALKIICREYIKNHPELFEETKNSKSKSIKNKKGSIEIRGGELVSVAGMSFTIKKLVIEFVAENGITTFVSLALGKILESKGLVTVLTHNIPNALENSAVQNLTKNNKFRLVDSEKVYLELCNSGIKFLVDILEDLVIPYSERKEMSDNILIRGISDQDLGSFSLCLVYILEILYKNKKSKSGFFILLKSLTQSIKEGRIPKKAGRIIRRKLEREEVALSPEFLDAIATSGVSTVMNVGRGGSCISIRTIRKKRFARIRQKVQKVTNKKIVSLLSDYGSFILGAFMLYKIFSSNETLNNYGRFNSTPAISRRLPRDVVSVSETISDTSEVKSEVESEVGSKVGVKNVEKQEVKELSESDKKPSNVKPVGKKLGKKGGRMVTLSDLPPLSNDNEELYETFGYLLGERPIPIKVK